MKANEFVKKFGLDEARKFCIIQAPQRAAYYNITGGYELQSKRKDWQPNEYCVSISEVKRLVESNELVMDYYGLTRAKEHAESKYTAPEIKDVLKQAIADVESCIENPN